MRKLFEQYICISGSNKSDFIQEYNMACINEEKSPNDPNIEATIKNFYLPNPSFRAFCDRGNISKSIISDIESFKVVKTKVCFVFNGLGSYKKNFAKDLYQNNDIFRVAIDECVQYIEETSGYNILFCLFSDSKDDTNINSEILISQFVVFTLEYAVVKLLYSYGLVANYLLGYSFGEYLCAHFSGIYDLKETIKILYIRGEILSNKNSGKMVSIPLPKPYIEDFLKKDISISINNGASCIVSGSGEYIDEMVAEMKNKRILPVVLESKIPMHNDILQEESFQFHEQLKQFFARPVQIPFLSNITGEMFSKGDIVPSYYWSDHLSQTVDFAACLGTLKSLNENIIYINIGYNETLKDILVRNLEVSIKSISTMVLGDNNTSSNFNKKILDIWAQGVAFKNKL